MKSKLGWAKIRPQHSLTYWIPWSKFNEIMSYENILQCLQAAVPERPVQDVQNLATKIYFSHEGCDEERCTKPDTSFRKILAILSYCCPINTIVGTIEELMRENVNDSTLPLARDKLAQKDGEYVIMNRKKEKVFCQHLNDMEDDKWDAWNLFQWALLAPFYVRTSHQPLHYVLGPSHCQPFLDEEPAKPGTPTATTQVPGHLAALGGFGEVTRVVIEGSHHQLGDLGVCKSNSILLKLLYADKNRGRSLTRVVNSRGRSSRQMIITPF
jgi:hypothetical protein